MFAESDNDSDRNSDEVESGSGSDNESGSGSGSDNESGSGSDDESGSGSGSGSDSGSDSDKSDSDAESDKGKKKKQKAKPKKGKENAIDEMEETKTQPPVQLSVFHQCMNTIKDLLNDLDGISRSVETLEMKYKPRERLPLPSPKPKPVVTSPPRNYHPPGYSASNGDGLARDTFYPQSHHAASSNTLKSVLKRNTSPPRYEEDDQESKHDGVASEYGPGSVTQPTHRESARRPVITGPAAGEYHQQQHNNYVN